MWIYLKKQKKKREEEGVEEREIKIWPFFAVKGVNSLAILWSVHATINHN